MPERDIVVIGASAGGVEALRKVVGGLRPDIRASFFVVLHVSPVHKSYLPEILTEAGPLPAVHAENAASIQPGYFFLGPSGVGKAHLNSAKMTRCEKRSTSTSSNWSNIRGAGLLAPPRRA